MPLYPPLQDIIPAGMSDTKVLHVEHVQAEHYQDSTTQRRTLLSMLIFSTNH